MRLGPSPTCLCPPRTGVPAVPSVLPFLCPTFGEWLRSCAKCQGHNPYTAFKTCLRRLCLQETPRPLKSPAGGLPESPLPAPGVSQSPHSRRWAVTVCALNTKTLARLLQGAVQRLERLQTFAE